MATTYTNAEIKERMKRVLTKYVELGVIGMACDLCGERRKTHQDWMNQYPAYRERFEELREKFVDGLESVAIERAKASSDSLLKLMLQSHRREVYGDRSEIDLKKPPAPITLVFAEGMLNEEEKRMLSNPVKEE